MDNRVIAHFTENQTENGVEMKMTTAKQVGGGGAIPTLQEVVNAGNVSTKGIEINETTIVGIRATSNSKQGIIGTSQTEVGVLGTSIQSTGVYGTSIDDSGVYGFSQHGAGVYGNSNDDIGVYGFSQDQTGVLGNSTEGTGVAGISTASEGVSGFSQNGVGVQANSANAVPLVANLSSFNTSNLFEAKKDGGIISFIDNNGIVGGSGFKTPTGTNKQRLLADGSIEEIESTIPTFQKVVNAGHISTKGIEINETVGHGILSYSTNLNGVYGNSLAGVGVRGSSANSYGVYATSQNNISILAQNSPSNNSDIFRANLGNVTKAKINKDGIITGEGFKTPTGTNKQRLKADGSVEEIKIIQDNTVYTPNPLVTLPQVVSSLTIPANFIQENEYYEVKHLLTLPDIPFNFDMGIHLNSSNTLGGINISGDNFEDSFTAFINFFEMVLFYKNNVLYIKEKDATNNNNQTAFDPTIDNYILISFTNGGNLPSQINSILQKIN